MSAPLPRSAKNSAVRIAESFSATAVVTNWLMLVPSLRVGESGNRVFRTFGERFPAPPHPRTRIDLPFSGCTGRAFMGYRAANASSCSCETGMGAVITAQLTTSEQGGVVSEPS